MNRDDAVTAVADALATYAERPTLTEAWHVPAEGALDAMEPYIAARVADATEALREGRQADRVRAAEAVLNEQLRTARAEAELDEARAALAADRERLAAVVEAIEPEDYRNNGYSVRNAAVRIIREATP